MEEVISKISNNPSRILSSITRIKNALSKIEKNINLKLYTPEEKSTLFRIAFVENINRDSKFKKSLQAPETKILLMNNNCGGVCNNVFYHSIQSAATSLAIAVGAGAIAGGVGGPAGMAAGAIGIAGAVAAYYVAEHYAYVALVDCFDACTATVSLVNFQKYDK